MLLLNFAHPLTQAQLDQVEALSGKTVERMISIPCQLDSHLPFGPQVRALLAGLPLSSEELQTLPILVNPPSLSYITALLLAELHGRMGYFPPIMRLRLVEESRPPRYEVAEILDLQAARDGARRAR